MSHDDADKLAQGRIYTGEQALSLHPIDAFGGLMDAVDETKRRAGLAPSDKVNWNTPVKPSVLPQLLDRLAAASNAERATAEQHLAAEVARGIVRIGGRWETNVGDAAGEDVKP